MGMLSKLTAFNKVICFLAKVQADDKAQVVVIAAAGMGVAGTFEVSGGPHFLR